MATDPKQDDSTNSTPVPAGAPEPSLLETTTAKDGELAVNSTTSAGDASAETPITISSADVSADQTDTTPSLTPTATPVPATAPSDISEEVESLSGEIQALEAKIDRLTGNVKPVSEPVMTISHNLPKQDDIDKPAMPPESVKPNDSVKNEMASATPGEVTIKPVETPVLSANKDDNKTEAANTAEGARGRSTDDIYSRTAAMSPSPTEPPSADTAEEVGQHSGLGLVGEVLSVIGLFIFLVIGSFPFYKQLLSSNLADMIRMIGWPTAAVTLFLGLILSLFGKGKVLVKILTGLCLIIAVIIYLDVAGYQNLLGPLGPILDSVLSFYR